MTTDGGGCGDCGDATVVDDCAQVMDCCESHSPGAVGDCFSSSNPTIVLRIPPNKTTPSKDQSVCPQIQLNPCARPMRPWKQCVESQLINDQVRRPMARWCHKRELPGLVLPCAELERLHLRISERERAEAIAAECKTRLENERLRSHCRQSMWNYTTESLLEKKRQKEAEKVKKEIEGAQQLLLEVEAEKNKQSEEKRARAQQLMLYRKGLIRDFHSSLAYSKMLQEIEDSRTKKGSESPSTVKPRNNRMNERIQCAQSTSMNAKNRPCPPELLEALRKSEARAKEHELELKQELQSLRDIFVDTAPECPDDSLRYPPLVRLQDKEDAEINKFEEARRLRMERMEEIQQKLDMNMLLQLQEEERIRKACEWKGTVDRLGFQTDKQRKMQNVRNIICRSEKAAAKLVEMQNQKKVKASECGSSSGRYDMLREQWEASQTEKFAAEAAKREKLKEIVYEDFLKRQSVQECRRAGDTSREWEKERLVAEENFHQECERRSEKRRQAQDIAQFNSRLSMAKALQQQEDDIADAEWSRKVKEGYEQEMNEMKQYAYKCIDEWKAKGRSDRPMLQAMKKWDYDAGMYPFEKTHQAYFKKPEDTTCPNYETTSKRLGFFSGGC